MDLAWNEGTYNGRELLSHLWSGEEGRVDGSRVELTKNKLILG